MSKILVYSLVTIILLSAIHEVVFAEDEMYVMFVEASEPKYANNLAHHTITTEIYSSVYYPAVVTI